MDDICRNVATNFAAYRRELRCVFVYLRVSTEDNRFIPANVSSMQAATMANAEAVAGRAGRDSRGGGENIAGLLLGLCSVGGEAVPSVRFRCHDV